MYMRADIQYALATLQTLLGGGGSFSAGMSRPILHAQRFG